MTAYAFLFVYITGGPQSETKNAQNQGMTLTDCAGKIQRGATRTQPPWPRETLGGGSWAAGQSTLHLKQGKKLSRKWGPRAHVKFR
jgi:hypothetical protein